MRLARLTSFASIGLSVVAIAGCYRPYMAPYGTPYSYPSAPVQTLTPGGAYAPYQQGAPGLSPTPATGFSQPNPTFTPGGVGPESNAPFYNNSNSSTLPYSNGVPQPRDAGEVQFLPAKPKAPIAEEFNFHEQGSIEAAGAKAAKVAKLSLDSGDFFEPIRSASSHGATVTVNSVRRVPGTQSPFAHDASEFRWLRGVARLDESTGAWSLIYSTVQTEADRFQGWLTLASDAHLAQLTPNGAYLVSGQLDESQTDPAGKPVYRVHSISPYTPSTTL